MELQYLKIISKHYELAANLQLLIRQTNVKTTGSSGTRTHTKKTNNCSAVILYVVVDVLVDVYIL